MTKYWKEIARDKEGASHEGRDGLARQSAPKPIY